MRDAWAAEAFGKDSDTLDVITSARSAACLSIHVKKF